VQDKKIYTHLIRATTESSVQSCHSHTQIDMHATCVSLPLPPVYDHKADSPTEITYRLVVHATDLQNMLPSRHACSRLDFCDMHERWLQLQLEAPMTYVQSRGLARS